MTADGRKPYSIRLSEEDVALLPSGDSFSESVRRAISVAAERRLQGRDLAELHGRLVDLEAALDARIDALGARARPGEARSDARSAGLAEELARRGALDRIERQERFMSELYDVATAAFRQVVCCQAALQTLLGEAASGDAIRLKELRELAAATEDALLKAHWDEFAETADRMRSAVFPDLDDAPKTPEPAATAAE
jgi:hypothetical protein